MMPFNQFLYVVRGIAFDDFCLHYPLFISLLF